MAEVISRAQAKAIGSKRYFTGVPCKRGHVVERVTINGDCSSCVTLKRKEREAEDPDRNSRIAKAWREKNPERVNEYNKKWYSENTEKSNAQSKAWRQRNPEKVKEAIGEWRKANPDRVKQTTRKWREENIDHVRERETRYRKNNSETMKAIADRYYAGNAHRYKANAGKRRALLISNKCSCCSDEQIAAVYASTRKGIDEVDHIIPLFVGGLHCCDNLQVLTIEEHDKKTALVDMPVIIEKRKELKDSAWLEI